MERLVIKSKAGSYYLNDAAREVMFEPHQRRLLLKRLYEYEDTGLTPGRVSGRIWGYKTDLPELQELSDQLL